MNVIIQTKFSMVFCWFLELPGRIEGLEGIIQCFENEFETLITNYHTLNKLISYLSIIYKN